MITDVEHLFMCLLTIYRCVLWKAAMLTPIPPTLLRCALWKNVYLGLPPILKKNSCSFSLLLSSVCMSPRHKSSNRTQCGQRRCVHFWAVTLCHPGVHTPGQHHVLSHASWAPPHFTVFLEFYRMARLSFHRMSLNLGSSNVSLWPDPEHVFFCRNSMDVASLVCIPQGGT